LEGEFLLLGIPGYPHHGRTQQPVFQFVSSL
jgi:hypothetical protein